jgi:hypothetical protein
MKLPTASSLHRALACPASAVLPRAPSTTSEAAERGTYLHGHLAAWAALGKRPATPPPPPEYAETVEGLDFPAIVRGRAYDSVDIEAAFAFDVESGRARFLGSDIGRDYGPLSPTEIAGTADLVVREADGTLAILDYKSGQSVGAAATNPQMHFLALAVARFCGVEFVAVELVYLGEDGSHRVDRACLDSLDLDSFAATLRQAVTLWRSPEAATQARPGDHCRYCPCFDSCPAQHQLVRTFASTLEIDPVAIASLSPEAAGRVYEEAQRYQELLKQLFKHLGERAHRQPLILPSGARLGYREQERRELSPEVAAQVVRERYGEEVAALCVESSVSQAAIKRALAGKRGAWLEVVREVEARGGIKRHVYTALKELPAQLEVNHE